MNRFSKIKMLSVFVLFLPFVSTNAFGNDEPAPTISVTGSAKIKVEPDTAVLSFSIQGREKTLDAAVQANQTSIESVMKFLASAGVEANGIRADLVRIQPIFKTKQTMGKWSSQQSISPNSAPFVDRDPLGKSNDQLKPIGYEARRSITVTLKDLSKLEDVYTGLLKNGVNEINQVSFQTTDLRKYRDRARLEAIRAARQKAAALAGELGASLAGVQQITEPNWAPRSSFGQNSVSLLPGPARGVATMSRGMIDIDASVSVVFLLGNNKF